ncbi:DUF3048 domain-containing protein [Neobacillus cucumis]|uniref:DUF3048 domain-containing protein n=1 Tax=Neobacillus cucumis TaxID=1740721 RepID=A0A2N5HW36_9BACI|nr:DUF3048 domain-containing protein [Neobacillus cucumis]PLS09729.1 DUF3048 domain-containing protein [Neobacillus cucumis]
MKKWAVAVTAIFLLLTGCNNKETVKRPVKEEKPDTKHENKPEDVAKADPYFYPLTGIGTDTKPDDRAVAVMINNHPKARPQSGLNKADIIYEVLAEGDITRFLAVFQSEKPANIGPVRSARDYYIQIAKGFNALYIAHGWSEKAKKMLQDNYVDNLNGIVYDGTLFKRSSARKAPHNSYITYENILKGAKQKGYSMKGSPPSFKFLSEEERKTITGNNASTVKITYSRGGISDSIVQYDSTLGKYKRFSEGEQTVDLETKEPILLDNLFIIETPHKVIDSVGHKDIDLQSGGKGYLMQMGKVMEVEWANRNGRIVPVKSGEEVPFVQGKTWVNVVPSLQKNVIFNTN